MHDAGRIIDPLTARSQINGGILMGIGFALFENRRMDPQLGIMVNPTMDDYKLLGSFDVPQIDVMFVEVANGITNTGVMGLGEVAHVASCGGDCMRGLRRDWRAGAFAPDDAGPRAGGAGPRVSALELR